MAQSKVFNVTAGEGKHAKTHAYKVKVTKVRDKNSGEVLTLVGDQAHPHGDCVVLSQEWEEHVELEAPAAEIPAPAKGKGKK